MFHPATEQTPETTIATKAKFKRKISLLKLGEKFLDEIKNERNITKYK